MGFLRVGLPCSDVGYRSTNGFVTWTVAFNVLTGLQASSLKLSYRARLSSPLLVHQRVHVGWDVRAVGVGTVCSAHCFCGMELHCPLCRCRTRLKRRGPYAPANCDCRSFTAFTDSIVPVPGVAKGDSWRNLASDGRDGARDVLVGCLSWWIEQNDSCGKERQVPASQSDVTRGTCNFQCEPSGLRVATGTAGHAQ